MTDHEDADLALARALQAEELAAARGEAAARDAAAELSGQVEYGRALAAKHLDPTVLAAAADAAPLASLRQKAGLKPDAPPTLPYLRALLHWFKHDNFFTWFDTPPCPRCAAPSTTAVGAAPPTPAEAALGCGRVELYACGACSARARFPRHNDVPTLLAQRTGRCGEWANAFTAVLAAAGFPARFIVDAADHVWCEAWCDDESRWIHADPCEALADEPLIYEAGWGKTPTWVFAFGDGGAADVTRRYTAAGASELKARRGGGATVESVAAALSAATAALRDGHAPAGGWGAAHARAAADAAWLAVNGGQVKQPARELGGRTAGGEDWVKARGEDGAHKVAPAAEPTPAPPAADFEDALRAAFDALRVRGLPPNRAAVVALGEASKVAPKQQGAA